jgi:glycosyltransferase involved in cell wall biosynthesis
MQSRGKLAPVLHRALSGFKTRTMSEKPLISGFSLVRNGEKLGYPYLEALRSLAPLVDELVVAVGDSEDATLQRLGALRDEIPCPLVLFDSPWDPKALKGGFELARQTNLALDRCRHEVCLYIQADEVLHEDDAPVFLRDLERFANDPEADALAFQWVHFYGNFNTIVESRKWYRREIRAIKRSRKLRSYGDAQGFRIYENGAWAKPRSALSSARYLHYGWVRPPQVMAAKSEVLDRLWHGDARDGQHRAETVYPRVFGMKQFRGTHPRVMHDRIARTSDIDPFQAKNLRRDLKYWRLWADSKVESLTGWRAGEWTNWSSLKHY